MFEFSQRAIPRAQMKSFEEMAFALSSTKGGRRQEEEEEEEVF